MSPVEGESLQRYRKGGYHPITLGQHLRAGRYKVLHKLGWGGYSTVWAARDQRLKRVYVAIKISISETNHEKGTRELQTLKKLASHCRYRKHIISILDTFELNGPNGMHRCLVYELLGPNIPDIIDAHFPIGRLPGKLAKRIAKQFTDILGKPELGLVRRLDGQGLEANVPSYMVKPTPYPTQSWDSAQSIKIIDFGESFLRTTIPQTLHTPLPVRAPEVIFEDRIDYQVDLWSMGCMLFELFTGQPPFDTFMITRAILVAQMREMASDDLPARWQQKWNEMNTGDDTNTESTGHNLQEWLEEVYFDGCQSPDLTRDDILKLGQIIGRLLKFEPSARASAREILDDPWFDE
ncbi:hypothetical protein N7457_007844 [Penicillium paradoxum]|uniref:uncharacterized protein n=1 Tax=Penicillium paradoxum TaxID=176176 RepID=UPI002547EBEE|nr:uncharacterized protein N7457_007844 [Penicillium paradoxum]KAJ5772948.1 hypothetical protein N7457_007844 [Penicillium paradoxum]